MPGKGWSLGSLDSGSSEATNSPSLPQNEAKMIMQKEGVMVRNFQNIFKEHFTYLNSRHFVISFFKCITS